MDGNWQIIEARVDWITATARTGERATELLDHGASILYEERTSGNYGRPSNFEGYHGTATAHSFVGFRTDSAIVRLGGELARDKWRVVHGSSQNVSRLDIAVTVQDSETRTDLAVAYWDGIRERLPAVGRPTEVRLVQALRGGSTLYLGERSSDRFGRIYNKTAQTRGGYPEGCWRFELEYKKAVAAHVADTLAEAHGEPSGITQMVYDRYLAWGIECPWQREQSDITDTVHRDPTDNETRFRWLSDQVRASIERLSTSYTADELRIALGLQHSEAAGSVRERLDARAREVKLRKPPGIYPTVARRLNDAAIQAELDRE
jgi:hypothetical protein